MPKLIKRFLNISERHDKYLTLKARKETLEKRRRVSRSEVVRMAISKLEQEDLNKSLNKVTVK